MPGQNGPGGCQLPPWRPVPPVASPPGLDFTLTTGSQLCCAPGPWRGHGLSSQPGPGHWTEPSVGLKSPHSLSGGRCVRLRLRWGEKGWQQDGADAGRRGHLLVHLACGRDLLLVLYCPLWKVELPSFVASKLVTPRL